MAMAVEVSTFPVDARQCALLRTGAQVAPASLYASWFVSLHVKCTERQVVLCLILWSPSASGPNMRAPLSLHQDGRSGGVSFPGSPPLARADARCRARVSPMEAVAPSFPRFAESLTSLPRRPAGQVGQQRVRL